MEIGRFAVLRPLLGGLGVTYDDHLRLIGKCIVDFLLVLIELLSPAVMAEALRANIGSKSAISLKLGLVYPKFQVEGVAPTNNSIPLHIMTLDKLFTHISVTAKQYNLVLAR